MNNFSFDRLGFRIDGKDAYMISGEFHYFRVPRFDWARRIRLFKEAGGNCIATYVPWLIHEPEEGNIVFGDVDNRDLIAFLETAQQEGIKVVLRPGPYQYSELINDGLPEWLLRDYPEVLAKDIDGNAFRHSSISYLHPVFLAKARVYFRAFAELVRPYMMENGGPVCMLQVDNELTGIHVWFGSLDYNPDTFGFGKEDGRYPLWLQNKYETVEALNAAYDTAYTRFADVMPIRSADTGSICSCRRVKDYHDFYRSTIAEYAVLLTGWLREDGLGGPICHNSATPTMNCQFPETVDAMGENFLLGSDHYYTLDANWAQNNPTPQYALRVLMSADTMRAMGMPPSVLELPGGSPSDTPPILPEDLLACYMCNLALGIKGVNYYVYTGGPNFPDSGNTCDIYDYNALVRADGSLNDTYASLKTFGEFMTSHSWLQRGRRIASAQIGFEWNTLRCDSYNYSKVPFSGARAGRFTERGILYTMMCSRYSPEMVLLTSELDISRPLIVPCPGVMSKEAQENVISFMKRGGKALILPYFPEYDTDLNSCSLFSDILGDAVFDFGGFLQPIVKTEETGRVYGVQSICTCEKLPENARAIAEDAFTGKTVGFEMAVGVGKMIWFAGTWEMKTFDQARMLEHFMEMLGGKPCVESSNRNIFTTLWTDDDGRRIVFAMNLYSSRQKTDLHIHTGKECSICDIQLAPMEVKYFEL